MSEPDTLVLQFAKKLYRQRAALFYAGLPIPPWEELTPELRQNHSDYVEKLAAKVFNDQFDAMKM